MSEEIFLKAATLKIEYAPREFSKKNFSSKE